MSILNKNPVIVNDMFRIVLTSGYRMSDYSAGNKFKLRVRIGKICTIFDCFVCWTKFEKDGLNVVFKISDDCVNNIYNITHNLLA